MKKYFEEKKRLLKFKLAGPGHKLSEPSSSNSASTSKADDETPKRVDTKETEEVRSAALAPALQRSPGNAPKRDASLLRLKKPLLKEAELSTSGSNTKVNSDDSCPVKGSEETPVSPGVFFKCPALAANEAREYFEKTSRIVQDIEREMANLKNFLSKDYCEEDEFVPSDGQCFTYTDREDSYKLCPFDQVTQMGKSGGGETRLGIWSGWGDKTYSIMLYNKGQSCWSGPQRLTKVIFGWGLENEVKSATEPYKCEYILEFKTPAARLLDDKPKDVHEEL